MPPEGHLRDGDEQTPLIGRADELTRLRDLADRAVEEGAQVVMISGDAGIGKSSLSRDVLHQLAASGWATHVGNCTEHSARPLPFGPIITIVRSILLDHLETHDDLLGNERSVLAALLPELDDEAAPGEADTERLFTAITGLLARASITRPMAVLVEDVHWADAATRDLLAVLTHGLGPHRLLLIITERTAALPKGHPLRTWLAEQRRHPNVHQLDLEGFGRGELAEQAAALGADLSDDELDRLLTRTGGNAYFAHELLVAHRDGDDQLPATLTDFLMSRLERLGNDERTVLRAMAVNGGTVDHRTLEAMTPGLVVGPVLRNLFDAAIVVVDDNRYGFRHALLQDAILVDLLPFEAAELHRLAAEAIEADPRRHSSPSDLAQLAFHWLDADEPERSLATAMRAADACVAATAFETAAELALRALEVWPLVSDPETVSGRTRDRLLVEAAEWMQACQRHVESIELIDQALTTWAPSLPADRHAGLLANVSTMYYYSGDPAKATEVLEEAKRLIGDEPTPSAARVFFAVARLAVSDGQLAPALAAAERTIEIATEVGPEPVLIDALLMKGLALGVTRTVDEGLAIVLDGRERARHAELWNQVVVSYRVENQIRSIQEPPDRSIPVVEEGLAIAVAHCGTQLQLMLRLDLAVCLYDAGRFDETRQVLEPLLDTVIVNIRQISVHQIAALLALTDHDFDEVRAHLSLGTAIAERFQSAQETGVQKRALAEFARREGRLDDAQELIDEAMKLQEGNDHRAFARETVLEKARIVRAAAAAGYEWHDERERTHEAIAALDFPEAPTRAIRALATLELDMIDQTFDLERAGQVADELAENSLLYEAAQLRLEMAEVLVADRADRAQIDSVLWPLIELAEANGMNRIAERARHLAGGEVDAGRGEQRSATTADDALPNGLTKREVEVLALVAEGLTNKAIGERLYVSPRTVSTHVSNLLAKLHLSSRGEASAKYHQLGLDEIDLRDPLRVD